MKIDDIALASGFSAKDVARYRPMMERMVALALAEKDIAKPDDDGWIPWAGGECPIPDAKAGEYEMKFRDGSFPKSTLQFSASIWRWSYLNSDGDITAYRLISR